MYTVQFSPEYIECSAISWQYTSTQFSLENAHHCLYGLESCIKGKNESQLCQSLYFYGGILRNEDSPTEWWNYMPKGTKLKKLNLTKTAFMSQNIKNDFAII